MRAVHYGYSDNANRPSVLHAHASTANCESTFNHHVETRNYVESVVLAVGRCDRPMVLICSSLFHCSCSL